MSNSNHLFFKALRFRQLHALVELSRRKNFSETAEALGLSVVSAWRQIRALEEQFGVDLVVAKGPVTSLTEDGEMLVAIALPMVETFLSLPEVFASRQQNQTPLLTFTAPAGVLNDMLLNAIKRYRDLFPNVQLQITDRESREACNALLAGDADLAVAGKTPEDDNFPALDIQALKRYPIQLLCPADHPLASAKRLTVKQIARHPLALTNKNTSTRSIVEHVFAKAGVLDQLNVTISATRFKSIVQYVLMGFGVALFPPELANASDLTGLRHYVWRDVSKLFGYDEIALYKIEGRHESAHIKAFRELVEQAFQDG